MGSVLKNFASVEWVWAHILQGVGHTHKIIAGVGISAVGAGQVQDNDTEVDLGPTAPIMTGRD